MSELSDLLPQQPKAISAEVRQKLTKLANLLLADMPQNQVAEATGLSESRISQIIQTVEYKQVASEVAATLYEEQTLIDEGWDAVESLGLQTVIKYLQGNPDETFALKASALANKAVRRTRFRNNPVPESHGGKAVIVLNAEYANVLQNNFQINGNENVSALQLKKKDSDFLAPQKVQTLLTGKPPEDIKTHAQLTSGEPKLEDWQIEIQESLKHDI